MKDITVYISDKCPKCNILKIKLNNKGDMTMFIASVNDTQFADCDEEELLSSLVCSTFFEENGKKLPEANEYKFISPAELDEYLYASLVNYFKYNFSFNF